MSPTANDLLMGGGTKSASFLEIGASVTGRITTEPKAAQQTDLKDGSLKTFANGDPMMQIIVQLATDQRDPDIEDDDGTRSLYVKSNMLKAIREAVKQTGAKGLEVGGTLTVTYTGDGERTNKAFNPPKFYSATYRPPTAEAANAVLMGDPTLAATVVPTAGPAHTAAVAPAMVAGPAPAGIDPGVWSRLDPTQRAAVLAAATPAF